MQKNGILFTSDNCPDLTKISINGSFFIALNFNPNLKHGKFKALRTSFPLPTYFFCTV